MRVCPTRLGWCRIDIDGSPAAVRFDGDRRLAVAEYAVAGIIVLPLTRLVAWANGPDAETLRLETKRRVTLSESELAAADTAERSDPALRAAWGTSAIAAEGVERMVALSDMPISLAVGGAIDVPKPAGFYERFAVLYGRVSSATSRPAVTIAVANGVKVSAVHGWVKVCRKRGLL